LAADWTTGTPLATAIPINRVAAIPFPADSMGGFAQTSPVGGPLLVSPITATTPFNVSGLVTATTYSIRMAWFRGTLRLSDWSDPKIATTA